jgi:hypothetical protein
MKKSAAIGAVIIALIAGLAGYGYYLTHYVDSVRVVYKRWKAPNPYVFEEINPRYRKTDPAKLITVRSQAALTAKRRDLQRVIWGEPGPPWDKQPDAITIVAAPPGLENLTGLERAERLEASIDHGYTSYVYVMHPRRGADRATGRMLLYHHGYAGTIAQARSILQRALDEGDTVMAFNYPGYGENQYPYAYFPKFGWNEPHLDRILTFADHPIRFYVEPIVVALNHATRTGRYKSYDMIGFSAGGWTAGVAAAADPRLRYVYSVSGGYPLYLRAGAEAKQSAPPQYYGPLLRAANYLDMYVLGAAGPGRRFTQLFNRFDRCCFANTLGRLYEPAVKAAVESVNTGGAFTVVIDETHADHKVSDWAIDQIFNDRREQ